MNGSDKEMAAARHVLNNLFAKIMGAAELASHEPCTPAARAELETIVSLAEEGAVLVANLRSPVSRT